MNGAGLRKTALLAALAATAACCLGSSGGYARAGAAVPRTTSAGAPAGSAEGPAVSAGPVTAPRLTSTRATTTRPAVGSLVEPGR